MKNTKQNKNKKIKIQTLKNQSSKTQIQINTKNTSINK